MLHRNVQQSLWFRKLDELHDYAKKFHQSIKFEFKSSDTIAVKMHDELILELKYTSVTWNYGDPETHIINGDDVEKFDFLFKHIDLLEKLIASRDVKDVKSRTISIMFIYKDEYCVTYIDDDVIALTIMKEDSDDNEIRIVNLSNTSEIFEILDKNIKEFAK